jgi:hypothetical protein
MTEHNDTKRAAADPPPHHSPRTPISSVLVRVIERKTATEETARRSDQTSI